jgi:16S rRNA (cytidine1402-2'-O)-methyltransferase
MREERINNTGIFYIVGTPIGNLKDITLRALEVLKECNLILAEDTRVANKLLSHYEIRKSIWRADARGERNIAGKVLKELTDGKNIAFISDAGTPNISDPGAFLIRYIRMNAPTAKIVSIPGPSSLTSFISISGISGDGFTFFGYPPHKKGRNKFFQELKDVKTTPIVFFESPHRLQKTLENISEIFGKDMMVVIGKELTKIHEEIWQGTVEEAERYFTGEKTKGEFVVAIKI